MKKIILLIVSTVIINFVTVAQVAVNADGSSADASAMLEVKSTNKGILIPRMTLAERDVINSPATGLMIYQSDNAVGFYYYNGSSWVVVGNDALHINSLLDGKSDGNSLFLGANAGEDDDGTMKFNTAVGVWALKEVTSGPYNAAFGTQALNNLTTGSQNTAFGRSALTSITTTSSNTAIGYHAGHSVTGGSNVFIGNDVASNQTAISNRLFIDNSNASTPLIYGEFDNDILRINGAAQISGTLKIEGGSPAVGKLLVSDADGVSSWANPNDGLTVPDTTEPIPIRYHGSYIYIHPTDNGTNANFATAQSTCDALTAHGYDDWYLPKLTELNAMYKQSYLITGLEENISYKYWSNTEYDASNAYTQRLDYGGPDPDAKTDTDGHSFRCIRKN